MPPFLPADGLVVQAIERITGYLAQTMGQFTSQPHSETKLKVRKLHHNHDETTKGSGIEGPRSQRCRSRCPHDGMGCAGSRTESTLNQSASPPDEGTLPDHAPLPRTTHA